MRPIDPDKERAKMIRQLRAMSTYDIFDAFEEVEGEIRLSGKLGNVIEGIEYTRTGPKLRLPDRLKAMELLHSLLAEQEGEEIRILLPDETDN